MQPSEPVAIVDEIARRDNLAMLRDPRASLRAIAALAAWRPASPRSDGALSSAA